MDYDASAGRGSLWRIGRNGQYQMLLDNLTIPNGMDWWHDEFWFVDGPAEQISLYKWSESGLEATSRKIPTNGTPDGLTIDSKGEIWLSLWGEGRFDHFDSSGKDLRVRNAELDGLGDERERLVSHSGEGLPLFRGECRTDRQSALDLREMTLRGFQRGGVVGRCVGCCGWHIAFRVVNASRIPGSIRNRWWLGSENSLRYTQRALSNEALRFFSDAGFFVQPQVSGI
jgi:hypothetical protein